MVALVSAALDVRSGSNFTVAVFLSKSILASATPGTCSSDFLTVIGQSAQGHVLDVEDNRLRGSRISGRDRQCGKCSQSRSRTHDRFSRQ